MRTHPQQQRFERLSRAVDADVRRCGSGEHSTHGIERFGPGGRAVHELAVVGATLDRRPDMVGDELRALAVRIEDPVEVADVAGAERAGEDRRVAVVSVAAAEPTVVGDVPRALLEVAHQPPPFEHLRQQVRGLLAREVDATELGNRVVAVVEEHPLVELLRSIEPDRRVDRLVAADVEVADELVEEQTTQRLRAAAVASEQGALHHLRQIDQCKHWSVEIGEVPPQNVGFVRGERLGHVNSHGFRLYGPDAAPPVIVGVP